MNEPHQTFIEKAIELSLFGSQNHKGGPFGAVIVRNGVIVGKGYNEVTSTKDPTAHAEMMAIRDACRRLGTFELSDCVIYTSCEPCPMCLGAIYWARLSKVYYANSRADAAAIGFDDSLIYDELGKDIKERNIPMTKVASEIAIKAFELWKQNPDKLLY